MTTFLLEIGCEELPAAVCRSILTQLVGRGERGGLVYRLFNEYRLLAEEDAKTGGEAGAAAAQPSAAAFAETRLSVLVSPRRVAVLVTGVPDEQTPLTQAFRGPRADVAYGADGVLTKAGLGFARSRGADAALLRRELVDSTEFVVVEVAAERRAAADVVPELARRLICGIQVTRGMRWGARPADEDYLRFSRPVRWLVCKLGQRTIEFPFFGLGAGEVSQGHRVLGAPIIIDEADHYVRHVLEQKVVVSQDERRARIVAGLDECAARVGGEWFDPGDVLAEALYLVEWPSVHVGSFDARHLRLPDEVLVTAMQSHQRYFPVRDRDGKLLAAFLYVSNADPAAAPLVTRGNERVLEGRLDDAEFSYERDLAEGLTAMAAKLQHVVFHERLGSLADKSRRLERLVAWLAGQAGENNELEQVVATAAGLAKADLASQLVQEFPTLQGRVGGLYAQAAGQPAEVAQAIAEQYLPVSATAPVPAGLAGALLAVADKTDNIVGAWAADEKPSGSRDPYGLRRAAMGIVRIALEFALRCGVEDLLSAALVAYDDQGVAHAEGIVAEAAAFVWERLQVLLLDEGLPFPMVEAALGSSAADIPARAARARSFAALEGRDFFDDVVTTYSRCASLAEKANGEAPVAVDEALFSEPAEGELHKALAVAAGPVDDALAHLEISSALVAAAKLRPAVDRYFDDVLVMDPDPAVRANRLAQLGAVVGLLRRFGDFGRLPVPALKANDATAGATT